MGGASAQIAQEKPWAVAGQGLMTVHLTGSRVSGPLRAHMPGKVSHLPSLCSSLSTQLINLFEPERQVHHSHFTNEEAGSGKNLPKVTQLSSGGVCIQPRPPAPRADDALSSAPGSLALSDPTGQLGASEGGPREIKPSSVLES